MSITATKGTSLGGGGGAGRDPVVKGLLADETLNPPIDEMTTRKLLRAMIMLEYVRGNGALLEELAKAQKSPITALAFAKRSE